MVSAGGFEEGSDIKPFVLLQRALKVVLLEELVARRRVSRKVPLENELLPCPQPNIIIPGRVASQHVFPHSIKWWIDSLCNWSFWATVQGVSRMESSFCD